MDAAFLLPDAELLTPEDAAFSPLSWEVLASKEVATFTTAFDCPLMSSETSLDNLAPPARVFLPEPAKLIAAANSKSSCLNFVSLLEDADIVHKKQLNNFLYLVVT